ncbi:PorP/SprF family type IX secretion system membrane protein [Pontibacter anaerobius]|uniref:PorP/SprF family type IX secretion system membrane protein n=1 Tax=Pontibacter anaerobius TaxID=2993940 RepID=A0ABT3RHR3_9BACT|nr:PorP/SprF family type IX secretion system membrane protein [Pontibacter anaerobius]MCX2741154.1 PorP/SprF family type IX secretion system membrane protein [Pontibacter anaerobius]
MRRYILWGCLLLLMGGAQAQNRKQLANFTQYKHYFNPSLTGHEGSVLRSIYRNQWTGFEDAPKTIMASAELDLLRLGDSNKPFSNNQGGREAADDINAKHGLGLTLFHDQFGPAKETQALVSYGAGVRLSESLSLRWGAGVHYTFHRLDGNSLTIDQKNDPRFSNMLGDNNRSGRADIDLGLSLTTANFYLGYSLMDATEGKLASTGSDYLDDTYARRHVVQAGYRASITELLSFTLNGIYQDDANYNSTLEGQVKAVYDNKFWVGGGYRNDLAYSLAAGLRLNQLAIGYAYETPIQDAKAINKSTNEVTLGYYLTPYKTNGRKSRRLLIW